MSAESPGTASSIWECNPINAELSTLQFHPSSLRASFVMGKTLSLNGRKVGLTTATSAPVSVGD